MSWWAPMDGKCSLISLIKGAIVSNVCFCWHVPSIPVRGRSTSSDVSSDISPSPLYIPPHRCQPKMECTRGSDTGVRWSRDVTFLSLFHHSRLSQFRFGLRRLRVLLCSRSLLSTTRNRNLRQGSVALHGRRMTRDPGASPCWITGKGCKHSTQVRHHYFPYSTIRKSDPIYTNHISHS